MVPERASGAIQTPAITLERFYKQALQAVVVTIDTCS